MDKPPPYEGPAAIYPREGDPPLQADGFLQSGNLPEGQPPPNYTPQAGYQPHIGYQPNLSYQPQAGYQQQQVGYPPQNEYQPPPVYQPHTGGYQPQQGFPQSGLPQSGYLPSLGYEPKPVDYIPPQTFVPQTQSFCELMARNRPQSNSLAAATFIFMSGGMSLAWGVGFESGRTYQNPNYGSHLQICWFIAVIIGAFLATLLVNRVTKRMLNLIAAVLVIINGIIFAYEPYNEGPIALARYCDGIAFGLTIIPAIVAGSEQPVIQLRGMVLSFEHVGLLTGMIIKTTVLPTTPYSWNWDSDQMQGVFSIIFGIFAIVFAIFLTKETASFYLRKGKEPEAINSLRRLQVPQNVTSEIYAALYENKHILEEDAARGLAVNIKNGLMPMVKLCFYRVLVSISLSVPLTWAFIFISTENLGSVFCAPIRLLGVVFSLLTIDRMGRKMLGEISLAVGGCLAIAIAISFSSETSVTAPGNDIAAKTLLIVFQIFAGIAAPSSTCYLGEAFSTSVKPLFIFVAVTLENIVQIIICCSFNKTVGSVSSFAYALGIMQIAFAIIFFVAIPETKRTTLRQALAKFQKHLSVGNI